ncbi:MAG TPA: copper chaperone PCu(A)C [Acidimicrobiia bacterium]|nr:copper chaperone PCu(A)C [Acidimicrobiia bacterium]
MMTLVALAACGGGGGDGPLVSEARVGQPTGPNAALYFTAAGNGAADRLLGASSDMASAVELHETTTNDDGTIGMAPADPIDLPADGQLVLEPGGLHLMLIDVDRLDVGEMIEVTLAWETAGDMVIEAEVVDPAATFGEGHDH